MYWTFRNLTNNNSLNTQKLLRGIEVKRNHILKTTAIIIVLAAVVVITGSCEDPENPGLEPVPGPNFGSKIVGYVLQNSSSDASSTVPVSGAKVKLPGTNMSVISDEEGSFMIYGLSSGVYDVFVETANGFVNHVQAVAVHPNSIKEIGNIIIGPSGEISGAVTLDSSTVDVKGITVVVHQTGQYALTNEIGEYKISGIPPGEINVSASRDSFCAGTLNNIVLPSDTVVVLPDIDLVSCNGQASALTGFAFLTDSASHADILVTDINDGSTTRTNLDGLMGT